MVELAYPAMMVAMLLMCHSGALNPRMHTPWCGSSPSCGMEIIQCLIPIPQSHTHTISVIQLSPLIVTLYPMINHIHPTTASHNETIVLVAVVNKAGYLSLSLSLSFSL